MGGRNKGGLSVLWIPKRKKHHSHHKRAEERALKPGSSSSTFPGGHQRPPTLPYMSSSPQDHSSELPLEGPKSEDSLMIDHHNQGFSAAENSPAPNEGFLVKPLPNVATSDMGPSDGVGDTKPNNASQSCVSDCDKTDSVYLRPPPPEKRRPQPKEEEKDTCMMNCLTIAVECCDCTIQ